jgi:predicted nucleic acid-binding protein
LTLVVDASVVVQAALAGSLPAALEAEELIAPALLWSESTSALHELAFRGEIDREAATDAIKRLGDLGITRRDQPDLYVEASRVARSLGWAKTYDAEYVSLARLTGSPLLTRDARLQRGAGRAVRVLGPEDLVATQST